MKVVETTVGQLKEALETRIFDMLHNQHFPDEFETFIALHSMLSSLYKRPIGDDSECK